MTKHFGLEIYLESKWWGSEEVQESAEKALKLSCLLNL